MLDDMWVVPSPLFARVKVSAGADAKGGVLRVGGHADKPFKLLWSEAGPPNKHDDKVDSDQ